MSSSLFEDDNDYWMLRLTSEYSEGLEDILKSKAKKDSDLSVESAVEDLWLSGLDSDEVNRVDRYSWGNTALYSFTDGRDYYVFIASEDMTEASREIDSLDPQLLDRSESLWSI
jgi:hypothetical protein